MPDEIGTATADRCRSAATAISSRRGTAAVAEQQLAIHRAKLVAYQEDERLERHPGGPRRGQRTVEHWRGATLPMGVLYEGAAVDFWTEVVAKARAAANARVG